MIIKILHIPEKGWCANFKTENGQWQTLCNSENQELKDFKTISTLKSEIYKLRLSIKDIIIQPKDTLHRKLVNVAYKWVLNNTSCGVAFKEISAVGSFHVEIADVIAFGAWGHSILIEVKTSRSDFLADKKKIFRQHPETGMGSQRFYCCPSDLIKPEEVPEGWGLIYVNEKMKARKIISPFKGNIDERIPKFSKNKEAELAVLYSVLRRLQLRGAVDELWDLK